MVVFPRRSRSVNKHSPQVLRRSSAAVVASQTPLQQQQQQKQHERHRDPQQDELWEDLFSNPSHWWDNRRQKTSPAYPDFRHKLSREPLWLDNRRKPPWVDTWLPTLHHPHHHHHHHHAHYDDADDDVGRRSLHHQQQKIGAQGSSHGVSGAPYHDDQLLHSLSHPDQLDNALYALSHMHTALSTNTYMSLLKACINSKSLSHAKQVYAHLTHYNTQLTGLLGDYLVVTLAKCGAVDDARQISVTLPCRTVFSWTAIISAYAERGRGHEALKLHQHMQEDGVEPNHFTFVSLFQACGSIPDLERGKKLHADARRKGFISNRFVGNSLVSMYARCRAIKEAEDVFSGLLQRDVVSWNAMLSAYAEQGQAEKALWLYRQMQEEGESPDHLTTMIALQACGTLAEREKAIIAKGESTKAMSLEIGQALHANARRKCHTSDVVVGTALVRMYGKCGTVVEAEDVFGALSHRDIVTWNVLLAAYVEQGHGEKALQLYVHMQKQSVTLDEVTCICGLQACSETEGLEICKQLHFDIVSAGYDSIHSVAATLIHTYRSCASMLDAQAFFDTLSEPDYVSWTTCIAGHAGDGNSVASLHMFENLKLAGIKPDEILFTAILSACSHAGLVLKGLEYFVSLSTDYGFTPNLKHYGIMLDLLGRAGDFKGVEIMLKRMPMQADLTIWLSLLGACRTHGHVELAKQAFDYVVNLQPEQTFAYILMSNIYVDAGLQECAVQVENSRRKQGAGIKPNQSWIEDEQYTYLL